MKKSCSRCGQIHDYLHTCTHNKTPKKYRGGEERKQRSTYAWQKKSREVREAANHLCEYCKHQGRYTSKNLEVHHITKLKDRPDLLLEDSNLICLCSTCHKQADKGNIPKNLLTTLTTTKQNTPPP